MAKKEAANVITILESLKHKQSVYWRGTSFFANRLRRTLILFSIIIALSLILCLFVMDSDSMFSRILILTEFWLLTTSITLLISLKSQGAKVIKLNEFVKRLARASVSGMLLPALLLMSSKSAAGIIEIFSLCAVIYILHTLLTKMLKI